MSKNMFLFLISNSRAYGNIFEILNTHHFSVATSLQVERAESVWYLNYNETGSVARVEEILELLKEQQVSTDVALDQLSRWPHFVDPKYPTRARYVVTHTTIF